MRFILTLFVCLTLTFAAHSAEARTVRVGIYDNPPMIFKDTTGEPRGIGVDVLHVVAEMNDWDIHWVHGTWSETLDRLDANTIDLMFPIAFSRQRLSRMHFNDETILTNWGQVYVQDDSTIQSIPELDGTRIAVLEDDIYYVSENGLKRLVSAFNVHVEFLVVDSYREVLEAVHGKRADAGLVSRLYGQLNESKYRVSPSPILMQPIEIRFAAPKTDASLPLIALLDRAINDLKMDKNSSYYASIDRWIGVAAHARTFTLLRSAVLGLAVLLAIAFGAIALFRRQVRQRTSELTRKNRELEEEIIQRRKVDAELLSSQVRYSRLFHESFDPIFILTIDGEIIEINDQALSVFFGPDTLMTGKNFTDFVAAHERDIIRHAFARLRAVDRHTFETNLFSREGLPIHAEIAASAVDLAGSRCIQAVVHDITKTKIIHRTLEEEKQMLAGQIAREVDKRQMQERLLMQQSKFAALGEMIGAIAHQWRQPLTTIGLYVQDIEDALTFNELNEDYVRDFVKKAMQQINFMSKTIDDFRNFFTTNKVKEDFDICPVLSEVMGLVHAQMKNNAITCVVNFGGESFNLTEGGMPAEHPPVCARVSGYPNEFKQVILNLVHNSRDAIVNRRQKLDDALPGRISLDISLSDQHARVSIADNGGGVPESIVDRVFDPYFTTKHEGQGVGIGLYMSKTIIENNMGGRMWVENETEGARFIIELRLMPMIEQARPE